MEDYKGFLETSIGILEVSADKDALTSVSFLFDEPKKANPNHLVEEALFQLKAWFGGKLKTFDLPLQQRGTEFQQKVWKILCEIPFGRTTTYGVLAHKLGDKNLMRAVGTANGANPFAIVVPCHRVIGAGGSLVGYAGGLPRKKWLLEFEGAEVVNQLELFKTPLQ